MTKPVAVLLIVLAVAGVYFNSVTGAFLWDDQWLIQKNAAIQKLSSAPKLFTESLGGGYQQFFYRPLQSLSYTADWRLWKLDPRGYHVTNILLHALTAVLAYFLLVSLFADPLGAFFSAVLFALHPAHTEAVAYISGRADILAALFMLAALLAARRSARRGSVADALVSTGLFFAALLSKESALLLPALLFLVIPREQRKALPTLLGSYALAVAGYAGLRAHALGPAGQGERWSSFWDRLPGAFAALGQYLRLLIWPHPLHMEYGRRVHAWTDVHVLGGVLLAAVVIFILARSKGNGIVRFSIAWCLLCLAPVLNLVPVNSWFSEHWVYLASLGFFAFIGHRLASAASSVRARALTFGVFLLLAAVFGYLTVKQNTVWREPFSFYKYTLKLAPDSRPAWNHLGTLHQDIGDLDEAARCFVRAIESDPGHVESYSSLGNILRKRGRLREAILLYEKAVLLDPRHAQSYHNLANAVHAQGDYARAAFLYEKAIKLSPGHADTHFNLANEYLLMGRYADAEKEYLEALKLNPADEEAKQNLSAVQKRLKMKV